ncbi:MAG: class F sortase [Acidimicrobiales bacterium]
MRLLPHTSFRRLVLPAVVLVLALVASGCGDEGVPEAGSLDDVPAFASTTTTAPAPPPTSELASQVRSAGSAATLPDSSAPQPAWMSFDAIGIDVAPIIDVGVESNGDMEIPGASEVGWYRYGPSPGQEGSSVLAAHVAWNGQDGVFRRLTSVQPGQRFAVGFDDGSIAEYEVVALRQYSKDELPTAELFAPSGDPQVVLVTCGGSFNRSLNSYDDNIVAYAVPV